MARRGKSLAYLLPSSARSRGSLAWIVGGQLAVLRRTDRRRMDACARPLDADRRHGCLSTRPGARICAPHFRKNRRKRSRKSRRGVGQSRPGGRGVRAHRSDLIHDPDRPERSDNPDVICDARPMRGSSCSATVQSPMVFRRATLPTGDSGARAPHVRISDIDPLPPPEYRRRRRGDR